MMKAQWWWLDTHTNTKRSPWFQSTITELNEKTNAMLKLIEEDADSFAQRAEMYYKKRPELVSMVEDFYRTHRSLAERYDQVKPDTGFRTLKSGGSPFTSPRYHQPEKLISFSDKGYDSYSEICEVDESVESEVDDPDQEDEVHQFVAENDEVRKLSEEIDGLKEAHKKDQIKQKCDICDDEVIILREEIEKLREKNRAMNDELKKKDAVSDEVMILREEIEKLSEENRTQKDELRQKDEEKIKAIKHLSIAIDVLKQENVKMRSFIVKESKKWKNPFEFNKFFGAISGKLFNGIPKSQPSIVAL